MNVVDSLITHHDSHQYNQLTVFIINIDEELYTNYTQILYQQYYSFDTYTHLQHSHT